VVGRNAGQRESSASWSRELDVARARVAGRAGRDGGARQGARLRAGKHHGAKSQQGMTERCARRKGARPQQPSECKEQRVRHHGRGRKSECRDERPVRRPLEGLARSGACRRAWWSSAGNKQEQGSCLRWGIERDGGLWASEQGGARVGAASAEAPWQMETKSRWACILAIISHEDFYVME
jgi:hypothetical protein